MAPDDDITPTLCEAVREAAGSGQPLAVEAGGTKSFYGRPVAGKALSVLGHRGIVSYEPTELVITARAGTPLETVESTLAEEHQVLAFEPPYFGRQATVGGAIASGLSGPRRPYVGSARDFVLGVRILNGKGETLSFGGQVMKNVAGYDVSRLMTGAQGTLGILLEVSLKVLPASPVEITLAFEMDPPQALAASNRWAGQPLPLSGACHDGERLYIRLSGTENGITAARKVMGGEHADQGFWTRLRNHDLPFFRGKGPLWRLSVPPNAPLPNLPGTWLLDWGGAQRWLRSSADAADIRRQAQQAGGHATLFRGARTGEDVFHPLPKPLARLHSRLKQAFDPHGVLNPGRLYPDL